MQKPRPTSSALAALLALALLGPLAAAADAPATAQRAERAAAAALALSPASLKSGAASLGANDCVASNVGTAASACLLSPNGRYRLCLLQNADIQVQDARAPAAKRTLWSSGTANKVPARKRPAILCLLSSGLLAAYRKDWTQYWAGPKPPAAASASGPVTGYVQDDGVFAIYDARCNLLWSTTRRVGVPSVQPPCASDSGGSSGGSDGTGDTGAGGNSTGTDGTGTGGAGNTTTGIGGNSTGTDGTGTGGTGGNSTGADGAGGVGNNSTGTDGTGGTTGTNSTGAGGGGTGSTAGGTSGSNSTSGGGGGASTGNVTDGGGAGTGGDAASSFRIEMLSLVNNARQAAGVAPLVLSADLSAAADKHCLAMHNANMVGHEVTGEPSYSQRIMRDLGISWLMCGLAENTGGGTTTAADMFAAWMSSSAHSGNMLGSNYKSMGLGLVHDSWTALFAGCVSP